jgi:putative inorganic carbon (HCO3(-)) transporter
VILLDKNKMITWFDWITVFSFYGLIFFLPISTAWVETFSTFIISAFFFKRMTLYALTLQEGGGFRRWVKAFWTIFRPLPGPLNLPVGIFLLCNLISILISRYPGLSVKGFVCSVFQEAILFFALGECLRNKKRIQIFTFSFMLSIALVTINGLIQFFLGTDFIYGHSLGQGRVMSSFKHPNDLGAYLVISALFVFGFVLKWLAKPGVRERLSQTEQLNMDCFSPLMKWGYLLLFLLAVVCLGLTFSRGAWGGFALAMIFMGILHKRGVWIVLLIVPLFFFLFLPGLAITRNVTFSTDNVAQREQKEMMEAFASSSSIESTSWENIWRKIQDFTAMGRKQWWENTFAMIRQSPFFGAGVNTFSEVAPHYEMHSYAHNCYLQMAAEIGVLGLLSFFWIILRIFYLSFLALPQVDDRFLEAILGGSLAGLFGFLAHSFVDTNFYSVQLGSFLWGSMGFIVMICTMASRSAVGRLPEK